MVFWMMIAQLQNEAAINMIITILTVIVARANRASMEKSISCAAASVWVSICLLVVGPNWSGSDYASDYRLLRGKSNTTARWTLFAQFSVNNWRISAGSATGYPSTDRETIITLAVKISSPSRNTRWIRFNRAPVCDSTTVSTVRTSS